MTESQIYRAYNTYRRKTGVKATLHQLRHSYATMLFEANVPPEHAQRLLRHAQLGTTIDTYTDIRENKLKEIHESVYAVDVK